MTPPTQAVVSGGTATFNVTVTNSGSVALTDVVTSDPKAPDCSKTIGSLSVGASYSYICTKTNVTVAFSNFISVVGRNPSHQDIWANTTVAVTLSTSAPHISISKTLYPTTFASLGQELSYVFVAKNDGNVSLTNVTITDTKVASLVCNPVQPASLEVSASMTCIGTYTVTQADLDAGSITDTANASGIPPSGPAVSSSVSNTATSTATADITITMLPASQSIDYDATATFNITVTNTGAITLSGVNVTDTLAPNCNRSAIGVMAPGATTTYPCTKTNVTTTFNNVAVASGTPAIGPLVTNPASAAVVVVYNPHISLTKIVNPATYSSVGDVLNYTLTATNDGNVDLTSVSISDPTLGPLTCTPVTLHPHEILSCVGSHQVDSNDLAYGAFYNTAEVSALPPVGPAITGSSSVTAHANSIPDRLAASIDTDSDGEHEIVIMDPSGGHQQSIKRDGVDMFLGGWAPTEDWLVYDTNTTGQIYIIRPDGSENTLVPNLPTGTNTQPAWSPSGVWLVFVNLNEGRTDLYMIHPDGTGLTPLTNDTVIESDASWMTDSKSFCGRWEQRSFYPFHQPAGHTPTIDYYIC